MCVYCRFFLFRFLRSELHIVIVIVVYRLRCLSMDVFWIWIFYNAPGPILMLEFLALEIVHYYYYYYYYLCSSMPPAFRPSLGKSLTWYL